MRRGELGGGSGAGGELGGAVVDEVLGEAAEEEDEFLFGDDGGEGIVEVVVVGVVFGAFFAGFFAFGDDVVIEGDGVFVVLANDQFAPAPGEVDFDGELVAPG